MLRGGRVPAWLCEQLGQVIGDGGGQDACLFISLDRQPEMIIYQGAPHAFNFSFGPFDANATADAYARTIDFLQRTLAP